MSSGFGICTAATNSSWLFRKPAVFDFELAARHSPAPGLVEAAESAEGRIPWTQVVGVFFGHFFKLEPGWPLR
jgi:hypothetical protein